MTIVLEPEIFASILAPKILTTELAEPVLWSCVVCEFNATTSPDVESVAVVTVVETNDLPVISPEFVE